MLIINWFYYAYAISIDCPTLLDFSSGLGIQSRQPLIWNQLQIDCCLTSGVTCIGQRVTRIFWDSMSLNGSINGSINGSALPATLEVLSLTYNQLFGVIPQILPTSLTELLIWNNGLSGNIPTWPAGILKLDVSHNKLTGSLPVSPEGLNYLHVHDNMLSGDLPTFSSSVNDLWLNPNYFTGTLRLNKPVSLYINDNWITNVIILDTSALTTCDLSENPLLGSPTISNLTICTKIGLYNASDIRIDCPNMINFAFGLGIQSRQPLI